MNHILIESFFAFYPFLSVLIFLYAEIHYSFKGIYSRLKKKEPEIIADLPHRIEPIGPIPILILIKDADQFPILLENIQIELRSQEQSEQFDFKFNSLTISDKFWHQVLEIEPSKNFSGRATVNVTIQVTLNGKKRIIKNDNYNCTGHAPLEVFLSKNELPKSTGWYFGEFHCHTSYTNDQVEFGAPLQATAHLARAMGLSFFCATDHSYDLDDDRYNFLKKDPHLNKWLELQAEIQKLNKQNPQFVIVPGEEVSAGNSRNRNVHVLILDHPEFLPGDGDSAEKWLQTKPNYSIEDILDKIDADADAVAFAAHPEITPPFLQWLLVRRGKWGLRDYRHPRLNGMQIWNGSEEGFKASVERWTLLLLQGRRIFISGGNDAHGNFNRFRQIGFPFFTMRENHKHIFGKVRTGVYLEDDLSLKGILEAFKRGRMVITNGPFLNIKVKNELEQQARLGEAISGNSFQIEIECHSTPEFGILKQIQIYRGDLVHKKEKTIKQINHFSAPFQHSERIVVIENIGPSYFRAELFSEISSKIFHCLTNPIWINWKQPF